MMRKKFLPCMVSVLMMVVVSIFSGCDYEYDIDPGNTNSISISGFVVISSDSSPLSDVAISLYNDTELIITVFTDSDGYFSFGNVASGEYFLVPVREGYTFTPAEKVVTVVDQDPDQVLFRAVGVAQDMYSIEGGVFQNELPLSDVTVQLLLDGDMVLQTTTDSSGNYSFAELVSGTYTVRPIGSGYSFSPVIETIELVDQDISDVDFIAVQNVYTISGTITEDSAALEGVTVALMSGEELLQSTVTDNTGSYVLSDVVDGTYTLVPSLLGHHIDPEQQEVTVEGENITADFSAEIMVSLVFVGDMNLGRNVEKTVEEEADGDYTFPFAYVGDYLSSFDLTFGNLESIISDQGENTKTYLAYLGLAVSLRAAPEAINGLNYAGFDAVSVANNHTGDYGEEGMVDCFNRLNNAGITPVGGGMNYDEAHAYVLKEVRGTIIAYLAYTNVCMTRDDTGVACTSRWIALNDNADEEQEARPGIAWASDSSFDQYGDLDDMRADIQSAAAEADVVVVNVHFGDEYSTEPNSAQQELARAAIDAGASLVVGHHPHVIQTYEDQAVEEYNGGYIAYSLGNFVFDQTTYASTKRGMIVEAYIHDHVVEDVQVRYSQYNEYYQPVLEE